MWKKLADLAREHILLALLVAMVPSLVGMAVTIYEANVNRLEDLKVAEYKAVMDDNDKFLRSLSVFTEDLARRGTVDTQKRQELSTALVQFYMTIGRFNSNLPVDQQQPVLALQTSLATLRSRVQAVEKKEDLVEVGDAFYKVNNDMKIARPIFDGAVGKNSSPTT